jgi:hypothetical protein
MSYIPDGAHSAQTPLRPRLTGRIERRRLAIYSRSLHLGDIALRRGEVALPWRALDPNDRLVGLFETLREAASALVRAPMRQRHG